MFKEDFDKVAEKYGQDPRVEILNKGYREGGGVSYFAKFFINIDQQEERVYHVAPFHWSIFIENFAKKLTLPPAPEPLF